MQKLSVEYIGVFCVLLHVNLITKNVEMNLNNIYKYQKNSRNIY